MQELELIPMNISNIEEAKMMMGKSFDMNMKDFPDEISAYDDEDEGPTLEGVLDRQDAAPFVFYKGNKMVGGAVLIINEDNNNVLDILSVNADCLDISIGYEAWLEIEKNIRKLKHGMR